MSLIFLIGMPFLLSSCGFRPQYKEPDYSFSSRFAQVDIPVIADRYGQILRNNLTNFVGESAAKDRRYQFAVTLGVGHRGVGFETNMNTTRSEVSLSASYTFVDRHGQFKPRQGLCRTSEYYSLSKLQIFQNINIEKNAPLRGLETISRCLIDRLSILLNESHGEGK